MNSVKSAINYINKNKQNRTFIVKVLDPAPDGYYPKHWYFSTPSSEIDNSTKPLEYLQYQNKNSKITNLPSRSMNNSYNLNWQALATNQFCILYALYGILDHSDTKINFQEINNDKIAPEIIENADKNKLQYDDQSQRHNTIQLLTWFKNLILSTSTNITEKVTFYGAKQLYAEKGYKILPSSRDRFNKTGKYNIDDVLNAINQGIQTPEIFAPDFS